jgi:hypothetical protein
MTIRGQAARKQAAESGIELAGRAHPGLRRGLLTRANVNTTKAWAEAVQSPDGARTSCSAASQ